MASGMGSVWTDLRFAVRQMARGPGVTAILVLTLALGIGASTTIFSVAGSARAAEAVVEDDGPGVADTANLFVPFFTTKPTGSGIGLALARQIAEAHGGAVSLRDRATDGARGCQAVIRLPRAPAADLARAASVIQARP